MILQLPSPQPKQIEFLKAKANVVGFGGARGGGKSWAIRFKAIVLALKYKGIKILILRRSYQELRDNHILPLQKLLLNIAQWREIDKAFIFPNGSRIAVGYCLNDNDLLQYQGKEYDVIFMDEATHFSEYTFKTLQASIRGVNNFPKRMYCTMNPGGKGHAWVKRLFISKEYHDGEKPEDYEFIQSRVYDNEILMKSDPTYVNRLENLPEAQKKAWLYGDWDVFDGQFLPEFNRDVHVIDPIRIPEHWYRYTVMDYGMDMLAHYEIAVDEERNVYVMKEIHESNLIVSKAIERIQMIEDHKIYMRYAPPDLWNTQSMTGKSTALLFNEMGYSLARSNNDRISGWMALRELMKVTPKLQPDGTVKKTSKLHIFRGCKNLIECIPLLQYDEKTPNDAAKEPHELTHSTDALRYFAISWAQSSEALKPSNPLEQMFNLKTKNESYINYNS